MSDQRVKVEPDGSLVQSYSQVNYGRVQLSLNEETMQPIGATFALSPYPSNLTRPEIEVHWAEHLGESGKGARYFLRWESLGLNRDRPRTGPHPLPSKLRVVEVVESVR